ncbi:MAG: LCP family protein, partial [Clostridia bacterium]|nr:LCP family protein [Clostridia bacterium]
MARAKHAAKPVVVDKPMDQKKKKRRAIWIGICGGISVLVVGFVGIFWYFFGGLQTEELNTDDLGINSSYHSSVSQEKKITNIALFGIDSRAGGDADAGLSDAIMILSINHQTNKVKLISVMRDSYVQINGRGDKLTHAYGYGGAALAVKTLNENFNLDITDYVTVNFDQLSKIIDSIGGVYLDVTPAERTELNLLISEIRGSASPWLETSGEHVWMTGDQAVAYARIRKLDGDQMRTSRQREVLTAVFEKVSTMSVLQYPSLAKTMIPMVTTSFTYSDVLEFLPVLTSGEVVIDEAMIPGDYDDARNAMINGIYYMQYDLDKATDHIHKFIYEDIHPNTDPETLTESSAESSANNSSSNLSSQS